MAVVLDLGHTGRTGGRKGATHGDLREASIVRRYVAHAADLLEDKGVRVEIAGAGSYGGRQRAAKASSASAYIACHVNAGWQPGSGYRGAVFHGAEALASRVLAVCLAEQIEELTGSSRIHGTGPDDWTRHAHGLISQTGRVPAVVFEPVFIDNPAHRDLCEHPDQIGEALANGVLHFLQVR